MARGSRLARQLAPRIAEHPTRFITLTLRHSDTPLRDQLDRLYASFARLRRRPLWRDSQTGAAAFCEIKLAHDGRWHPHLHVLAVGNYIAIRELSREWHAVTGDSSIVDIRAIRNAKEVAGYVVKYASKPLDASIFRDPDRLAEAITTLRGRRLCQSSGSFGRLDPDADDGGPDDWHTVGRLDQLCRDAQAGDWVARLILLRLAHLDSTGCESQVRPAPA